MRVRLETAIDELGPLPVMGGTVARIRELATDPLFSTDAIVQSIEQDEAFAANLLRFSNSAALARPVPAKTIRQALMMVGVDELLRLAMAAATYQFLESIPGNGRVSRGQMHMHAISVASCAAATAKLADASVETAYTAGLLHDVGKLVMPIAFGEAAVEEIALQAQSGVRRVLLERSAFGVDHAYAGALLASRSQADDEVFHAIAWHHGGLAGPEAETLEVACVQVANCVVGLLGGGDADHELLHVALGTLGLDQGALDDLAMAVAGGGGTGALLADRVVALERLASTDELTGISNRRHWTDEVNGRLGRRAAGVVLIVDVDHFKLVNDTYGHAEGDTILREVARALGGQGFAGRLGGDEFALWVDGTRQDGERAAAAAAAALQAALQAISARANATLSIGLASTEHGHELSHLLHIADEALYAAKAAGRACAIAA